MKRTIAVLIAMAMMFNLCVFATGEGGTVVSEVYDFTGVTGESLETYNATNLPIGTKNAGFTRRNEGVNSASIVSSGNESYIQYKTSGNFANDGNNVMRTFENAYSGNVELSFTMKAFSDFRKDITFWEHSTGSDLKILAFQLLGENGDITLRELNTEAGYTTASHINYHDGQWHKWSFRFNITASGSTCTVWFDGVQLTDKEGTPLTLALKDTVAHVNQIRWSGYTQGDTFYIDDVTIANTWENLPGTVSMKNNNKVTLESTVAGDTIVYATGATAADAITGLASATTYSEPFGLTSGYYVAAKPVNAITGATKVFGPITTDLKTEVYDFTNVTGTTFTQNNNANTIDTNNAGFITRYEGKKYSSIYNDGMESYLKYACTDTQVNYGNCVLRNFDNQYSGNAEISFSMKTDVDMKTGIGFYQFKDNTVSEIITLTLTENGGDFTAPGSTLKRVNYCDNQWHDWKFKFKFTDSGNTCTVWFDGQQLTDTSGNPITLTLKSEFTCVNQIRWAGRTPGHTFYIDDVSAANAWDVLPTPVKFAQNGNQISLDTEIGDIFYGTGNTAEEAKTALASTPTAYSQPIDTSACSYIAASAKDSMWDVSGAVKVTEVIKYEMYDFSDDTNGAALSNNYETSVNNGVQSGFVLQNTGSSPARIVNDGVNSYIDGTGITVDANVNRIKKDFVNSYTNKQKISFMYKANESTYDKTIILGANNVTMTLCAPVGETAAYIALSSSDLNYGNAIAPFEIPDWTDGQWHKYTFEMDYGPNLNMAFYFDDTLVKTGIHIAGSAGFKSTGFTEMRFGSTTQTADVSFAIDDFMVANTFGTMPSAVTASGDFESGITLESSTGGAIKYAVASGALDAKDALKTAALDYSETIELTASGSYIATREYFSSMGAYGPVKVYGPYNETALVHTADEFTHLSPYSVLAAGGVSDTDTLQLAYDAFSADITYDSGECVAVADADSIDNAKTSVALEKGQSIIMSFNNDYTGGRTVEDITVVLGKTAANTAEYSFELQYKESADGAWKPFYRGSSTDTTTYTNDVYPTIKISNIKSTENPEVGLENVYAIAFKANKAVTVHEIDINMNDSADTTITAARAEKLEALGFGKIYADNAILQRDVPVKVWGYGGADGDTIKVEILNGSDVVKTAETTASGNRWAVALDAMSGGKTAYTLKATNVTKSTSIQVTNIVFGDVYVASGQSNMEVTLSNMCNNGDQTEAARVQAEINSNDEYIRIFTQSNVLASISELEDAYTGGWAIANSYDNVSGVSAVGYFFAKELYGLLGEEIPVAVLPARRGGTNILCWMPNDVIIANKDNPSYDFSLAGRMTEDGSAILPEYISNYMSYRCFSGNYNAVIAPLTKTAVKGVIWYQGEDDAQIPESYKTRFYDMAEAWRARFENPNMSFHTVQLSAYGAATSDWEKFRQAQLQISLNEEKTSMITTIDIGNRNDIHPLYKAPVGKRLALAAAALDYGMDVEYSGPLFDSIWRNGSEMIVSFTHADGLAAKSRVTESTENFGDDSVLNCFEISEDGQTWTAATAVIDGNTVKVSAASVQNPKYVRYAWSKYPENPNLFNSSNLPAVPFMAGVSDLGAAPEITGEGVLTVTGSVINSQKLVETVKVIIAKYNTNGALESAEVKDVKSVINETTPFTFNTADDADSVAVIVLNNMGDLVPLTAKGTK